MRSIFVLLLVIIAAPLYVGASINDGTFEFAQESSAEPITKVDESGKQDILKVAKSKINKKRVVISCNQGKDKALAQVASIKMEDDVSLQAKCCKKGSSSSASGTCLIATDNADTIWAAVRIPKPEPTKSIFNAAFDNLVNTTRSFITSGNSSTYKKEYITKAGVCPLSKVYLTFFIDADNETIKVSCGNKNTPDNTIGKIGKGDTNYGNGGGGSNKQPEWSKTTAEQAALQQGAMQMPYYNPPPQYGSAPMFEGEEYNQYNNTIGNQEDSEAIDAELDEYSIYKDDNEDDEYKRDDGAGLSGSYIYEEVTQLPADYDIEEFYYSDNESDESVLNDLLASYQPIQARPWELDGYAYQEGKAKWLSSELGEGGYGEDFTAFMIANGVPQKYAYATMDEETWGSMSLIDKVLYSRNRDAWDARFGDAVAADINDKPTGYGWYNPYGWWVSFRDWVTKTNPASGAYDI